MQAMRTPTANRYTQPIKQTANRAVNTMGNYANRGRSRLLYNLQQMTRSPFDREREFRQEMLYRSPQYQRYLMDNNPYINNRSPYTENYKQPKTPRYPY